MYNVDRLSRKFIEIFRFLNKDNGENEFLNMKADHRCSLMLFHLVLWEVTAMFYPEKIKIDVFDILCKNGSLF